MSFDCYLKIYAHEVSLQYKVEGTTGTFSINPGDIIDVTVPKGKRVYLGKSNKDCHVSMASLSQFDISTVGTHFPHGGLQYIGSMYAGR